MSQDLSLLIANEINATSAQVTAAINLLDEGNTVPFIARYRKEVTGGLDDSQLRLLETRLIYLREVIDRKRVILKSIEEQGKLTPELETKINGTLNKTELEDLYLPYKPKRRTRGQIAIEAGLLPLAEKLWTNSSFIPENLAEEFIDVDKGITSVKEALDGARYILMEQFSEDADLLAKIRDYLWNNAHICATVIEGKEAEGAKFSDYFSHNELLSKVPSHRALAMFRGRNESILSLSLNPDPSVEASIKNSMGEELIASHLGFKNTGNPADVWKQSVINWTWKIKVLLHLETELMAKVKDTAETEAINVFARNLKDLLMAAPAGMKPTMGLDPGFRTGVKVAVIDATGKLVATETIYPHSGQETKASQIIAALCLKHHVEIVAIGNGTASRETERFFLNVQKEFPQITAQKVIVSEAGASVYSASQLAALEFPDLDVSLRGAVSIARRLQDPLAELVKIDPKSIGVGQYQHDVSQTALATKLDNVVEDCVNTVGVDLNTASVPLLTRVAGLNKQIAENIVKWRDDKGRFTDRKELLDVARLGPKAFEQCAGFLKISKGRNPLDASSVHPEAYPVVERILKKLNLPIEEVIGNSQLLSSLNPRDFIDDKFGLPTVQDILKELEKPGRDPRPEFKTATFSDGIDSIDDLSLGIILEGTVTNVTNFGAFVDIGVHQDGLVHISLLSDSFVDDPYSVVKAGDVVKVKVMEVDKNRQRIALSMRLDVEPEEVLKVGKAPTATNTMQRKTNHSPKSSKQNVSTANSAFGDAMLAALKKKS
ncbi:Tex family protein [Thorsellia kenyensis]|uniref:Tex family protein n=1 Tax=Thorsellia kenyensis TaxID=1549888 RepID=A0ABV6CCN1_9GAMM